MPSQRQLLGKAVQLLRAEQQTISTTALTGCLRQALTRCSGVNAPLSARLFASADQSLAAATAPGWTAAAVGQRARQLMRDYKQLSKFRLSALVVATSAAGFVAGSGEQIDWAKLAWTSAGTMGAAAAANTLNQWYEVQKDALMKRTQNRPLPRGSLTPRHALAFAAATGVSGVAVLYYKTNMLTAALGAANIGLYAGVYTPLKAVSMANTWVGAVVGAIPPLMGWAAAAGGLDLGSAALAAAVYFWQLPHFLSLAWLCREDYARGGYRMLSLMDATGRRTAACCLRNALYLMPAGLFAYQLGVASSWFATEAGIMAGIMAITAARFYRNPSNASARSLFRASLLYMPVFMVGLVVHRTPDRRQAQLEPPVEAAEQPATERDGGGGSGSGQLGNRRVFVPPWPLLPIPSRDPR